MHTLLERQRALEEEAMSAGGLRFRRRLEIAAKQGRGTQVGASRRLLQTAIEPLALMLESFEKDAVHRRGVRHQAVKWITLVGADTLSYMIVKVALDGLSEKPKTVRQTCLHLTELMIDELRYRRFREQAPELFDYKLDNFHTSNYTHMRKSMDASMGFAEIDCSDLKMADSTRLVVGTKLIDLMISATGLMSLETVTTKQPSARGKHRTETLLIPTPSTLEWINTRNDALEFLWPVNMPMVVPPRAWTPTSRGGYRFALRDKYTLARMSSVEHAAMIEAADMPIVYAAVNKIQETAWRINPNVYALVSDIVARGGGMAGIPSLVNEPDPTKPKDIATNPIARKAWRKLKHGVVERNTQRKMKALEFTKTLSMATSMKEDAAIFFPCNLDFRGRVYPICNFLSPQGDDLSKSLLTFAGAKLLGADGAGWLALHGANCLGETPDGIKLSRCTLEERVQWITTHTPAIIRVAEDPFGDRWWAAGTVDDPLQFYAFCCEWASYAKATRSGENETWTCSLPCAMDGTCNGLQHFAAMLRDPVGGLAVNVVPSERPNDIYQRISDETLPTLERDASDNKLAALWLTSKLVDRKLSKRPTMTFGYGSKKFGFKQQLVDYVLGLENVRELRQHFSETDETTGKVKNILPHACGYMSGLIWDALQVTVVAASVGMKWMQDAARCVSRNGKCVQWIVPGTNFPVRQGYMHHTSKQIETVLAGKMYQPRVYTMTERPDAPKQANAVAPNFVHSLDAAALMMTVEMAAQGGVESFGMVHDSYATHAGDAEELARCTRQAFHDLYTENDVIESFARQMREQAAPDEKKFPSAPPRGSLDLSVVLRSPYFFS